MKENRNVSERIVRLPEVVAMVGLCRGSIYNKIKAGEFPKQIKLGRLSGWLESEVQGWIRGQVLQSRPDLAAPDAGQARAA